MSTSFTKALFLTLFAMLFSIGQICACAEAQTRPPALIQQSSDHVTSHSVSTDHAAESDAHSHNNVHDTALCDKECSHACTSCEANIELATWAGTAKIPSADSSQTQPSFSYVTAITAERAFFAPSALAGLRWLDPPQILTTPVSLKIRLLN